MTKPWPAAIFRAMEERMISLVVPTLNAAPTVARSLESAHAGLRTLAGYGVAHEMVVADGGSSDATVAHAESIGARIVQAPRGRGQQLAAGADAARGAWLLFLHADTTLGAGWQDEVRQFIGRAENRDRAAAFRFTLDDRSRWAGGLERLVAWRSRALGLPYGDQGLLIHRTLYDSVGGFPRITLMEDVAIIRRIGKRRLAFLESAAVTSATRYQRAGYPVRMLRNATCLALYFLGTRPALLARLYG